MEERVIGDYLFATDHIAGDSMGFMMYVVCVQVNDNSSQSDLLYIVGRESNSVCKSKGRHLQTRQF